MWVRPTFLQCRQQGEFHNPHRCYGSFIRAGISPAERLALTLHFLATENLQVQLWSDFKKV